MLPLAERTIATLASTVQDTIGMEPGQIVKSDLLGRVLPAEDAATLSAMVAPLEETKRLLAG